ARGDRRVGQQGSRRQGGRERDRRHAQGLARRVDAEAHRQVGSALALSRDLGPLAHGRSRQDHHHPRRRLAAPPPPAILGGAHARPFGVSRKPLTYIGWGKTPQLGYGLGLAMGAKLARPDMLCINVWGDAAIGFTGMDFETAVRERIPIMSILLNNFSMAIEIKVMPISTEKYRSTDISGDYAAMARAFGGYGERVTKPDDIVPAIRRGIQKTQEGIPVLLEFITSKETEVSRPGT